MLSAYSFRQFARSSHAGAANNIVMPEQEFYNLRQRVLPWQCQCPVSLGLCPNANSATVRREGRGALSVRVNFGLRRTRPPTKTGAVHIPLLRLRYHFSSRARLRTGQGLIRVIVNREWLPCLR
jgi:hypothetical protein